MTQDSHDEKRRKHMAVMDDKEKGTQATTEQVKDAIGSLKHLVECRCDEAYTGRSRHDPYSACDYADEVKILADHVAAIEAKLARAEWLLTDAMVQLEEGKIKTRRNRARLIREFLSETKGENK
jgi:hypothetical protein